MKKSEPKSIQVAASLTWEHVRSWRAHQHNLVERASSDRLLEVTSRIGGLHAQLMSSAELTLWARVDGLRSGFAERLLWEERSLVKLWAMRGTLHLIPSAEYRLWQAGLSTYRHYLKGAWFRGFGMSLDDLQHMLDAISQALDGQLLTREDLAAVVTELTGSAGLGAKLRESWGAMLKPASFQGQLCFGPNLGQRVRFTSPDTWLGTGGAVPPAEARLEITRRFLRAYGPATREEYARWWGTTPVDALAQIKALGDEVVPVDVEGTVAWLIADDVRAVMEAEPSNAVRLLPAFDQYVVEAGLRSRHFLPGDFKDRIYRPQGWISPAVVVDGRMDGVWSHERRGTRLIVRVSPFVALSERTIIDVEEEAARLAEFLGGRLELVWEDKE